MSYEIYLPFITVGFNIAITGQSKLNNRPRKKIGYETPNYVYSQTINNNGQKVAFIT